MITERPDARRWVAEAIGTFFLVFAGAGAVEPTRIRMAS